MSIEIKKSKPPLPSSIDLRKIYKFVKMKHEAGEQLPKGPTIYYECAVCSGVVYSVPFLVGNCECGNLKGKDGSVAISDVSQVRPVKGELK